LTDVLEDVVQYLKYNDTCVRSLEFQQQPLPVRVAPSEIITKEVLFSLRTMLCFPVEMGGLQDWVVTEEGADAEKIWGMAPWRDSTGGNMVGHSFSYLAHRNDFTTLNELWIRTCAARKTEENVLHQRPFRQRCVSSSSTTKVV